MMQYANVSASWLDMSSKVIMTETLYTDDYLLGRLVDATFRWWRDQYQSSQQARTQMTPVSLSFCPFRVQASISAFLRLLRKQAMLSQAPPLPPSLLTTGYSVFWTERSFSEVWNETNPQANSKGSCCIFNMHIPLSGIVGKVFPLRIEKAVLWKGSQRWQGTNTQPSPDSTAFLKKAID